jgi:sirohydrochlorin ferrochelatase
VTFLKALAPLAIASGAAWGALAPPALKTEKAFGVLLFGEGGDRIWAKTVRELRQKFSGKFPLEFAGGLADAREIRRAIERLEAQRVKRIVALPLFLSASSPALDQTRFLLGLREKPSNDFLLAPHSHVRTSARQVRVSLHTPLAMTPTLGEHPLLVEIIAARAKARARTPEQESLVLVGPGPGSGPQKARTIVALEELSEKVRQKAGFKATRAALLPTEAGPQERLKAEQELKILVRSLRRQGPVTVFALELSPGSIQSRLPAVVEGLMVRTEGQALLPDPWVARWIEESTRAGLELPDMRITIPSRSRRGFGGAP